MRHQRGEIWWASLPAPQAAEPGFRRPVLVVQSNRFNRSRINTAVVVPLTSNLALAEAPGNVRVKASESGLPKASVVNVSQLLTVDTVCLNDRVAAVPAGVLNRVTEGLRLVLGL